MSNYSPVEVNYSIKVCVFQVANLYSSSQLAIKLQQ